MGCLISKGRNFFLIENTICGRNLYSTSYVGMVFIEGVWQTIRSLVSFTIVMLQFMVDALVWTRPLPRFFKRASINLLSSRMYGSLYLHVIDANDWGTSSSSMRCLKLEFLKWNSLMSGGSTPWERSLRLMIISIFLW